MIKLSFFKKNRINNKHKTLFSNFVYLFVFQGLNVLLPLVTIPYIFRVVGVEYFGLLAFALAMITYFNIITDYGFNSTATRDASSLNGSNIKLSQLFNEVMSAKFFLLCCSFIMLIFIIFTFKIFRDNWEIYIYTFGSVVGQALFPIWFFQGVQKMRYISYINLVSKVIFTIAIFFVVKNQSDYYKVPILNSLGFITSGIISMYFIKKEFNIRFQLQSFHKIKEQLKKGFYMFLSEFKISLFTNTNIIILGIFSGNQSVGYFSSAEKLSRAIGNLQLPISNALFPYLAKEMSIDKIKTLNVINKITKIGAVIFLIVIVTCYIFAEEIILLVYGDKMYSSILIFKILIIIPLASFLDTMFGKQILLNLGKDQLYFKVILMATILNVFLNIILTYLYKEIGTAIALNMTQIFIVLGMWYFANREILKVKNKFS